MSKITKKQLHNGWHCHDTEIIKMKKELRELKQSVLRLEKLTDEKLLDEPQLKQLDQSVFDGADPKYITAATNEDGRAFLFPVPKSELEHALGCWFSDYRGDSPRVDGLFDASNWQNSLIERESKELTGSDLARAMLKRGDKYVMCKTSGTGEAEAMEAKYPDVIQKYDWEFFYTPYKKRYATPINNQGEPLTAAEAGL